MSSSSSEQQAAVRVAVAQCNGTVGDLQGNVDNILAWAARAAEQGAQLLVTPELALSGYPPEDLLLRPAFLRACEAALERLRDGTRALPGLTLVVGHPQPLAQSALREHSVAQPPAYNAASVLRAGELLGQYYKRDLPNYQVFDERRYFQAGQTPFVFDCGGLCFGINICEDAWFAAAPRLARQAGAQVLLVLNASPYHVGKSAERIAWIRQRARDNAMALVYAHQVGGQDEVVFDGASFVLDGDGALAARARQFEEQLLLVDFDAEGRPCGAPAVAPELDEDEQMYRALVVGTRDYVRKNGFPGALLGLSGGVDSALVLAIAVDALGADAVRAVMMPSPYTAEISWLDSREMARRLGVQYDEIAIEPMMRAFGTQLAPLFAGLAPDTTEENIQARIRGTLLMAISNKTGRIVLATGNKSEMATGYCTLYGDMAGGYAVIKDVSKTRVWRLARWRNAHDPYGSGREPIPERIITRAPSAELKPDQRDQDSLPDYAVLDGIMQRFMEDDESIEAIVAAGYEPADVERVTRLLKTSEYKRRQAPPGVRITHRAFGRDWRYPITSKFRA